MEKRAVENENGNRLIYYEFDDASVRENGGREHENENENTSADGDGRVA